MDRTKRFSLALKMANERKASRLATQIATRELIRQDALTMEEIATLVHAYPMYEVGKAYVIGDLFNYQDTLYEVIQNHTSQADWEPPTTTSLYKAKMPAGIIPQWIQPTGAHDAYALGDKVIHNDVVWVSIVDTNTWEPGVYGWEQE